MNIPDFFKTIYLGDRGCKSILINGWDASIKIQATCISRVRGDSWNYYTDEDIPNGVIVFEGVDQIVFDPAGFVPNDLINDIKVEPVDKNCSKYLVTLSIGSVDQLTANYTEVQIKLHATSVYLEDPTRIGVKIT